MRVRPFALGVAMLGALTSLGVSQINSAPALSHVQVLGAADPNATTHFSVYLPLTNQSDLSVLLSQQTDPTSPKYHQWLTPAQFKAKYGPNPGDVNKVKNRLTAAGFTIVAEHTQNLEVEGPVWAVEKLFATQLQQVQTPKGKIKFAAGNRHLSLPTELASAGAVIPDFLPHLAAHVHSVQLSAAPQDGVHVATGALPGVRLSSAYSWYYADDLNEAYDLPSFQTTAVTSHTGPPSKRTPQQIAGVGSNIGIVMSSVIYPADLQHSFNSTVSAGAAVDVQNYSGNSNLPVPTVVIRPVGNGSGPFNPNSGDALEASLDTQMSLGTAPGAHETLYDMEDLTDSSIAAAYAAVDEDNTVDVVSSSFGECELDFTPAYNGGVDYTSILQVFHSLFAQGNAQGITFVASSGDNGAVPCLSSAFVNNPTNGTSFVPGVENPASDPDVTGVGGTNLVTVASPGPNDAKYLFENADYDPRVPAEYQIGPSTIVSVNNNTWGSGGGYSSVFSKPSYQEFVNTGNQHSRAVPDVSLMMGGCPGDADLNALNCTAVPRSATIIFFANGVDLVIGTSSAAPELAGVLALAVELNGGRLGNVNPLIYKLSAQQTRGVGAKDPNGVQYFHRNISGNNNFYTVSPGQEYSPVLGNSTLDVKNFLQLEGAASAGTPSTPSNP